MTVRTRFAPSPTGYLHIGGVRTALFNWLFTRHHGGQFLLRIDDTDQERNVEAALAPILHGFRWLGIDWDEGPEVGGPHAPYYQSQRLLRYQDAVAKLLASGHAYRDYARSEEIAAERDAAQQEKRSFLYSRRFMAESAADCRRFEAEGRTAVVRLKMPREGTLVIDDLIRGRVEFDWAREQDHVIQRNDGTCLYHLASVVDDHDFEISHVIRAEEHLSNTPRQIFILESLNYPRPAYAHLPYVAEPGSKTKLSKRKLDKYLKNRDFAQIYEHGRAIAAALGLQPSAETFNPVIVDFYEQVGYLPDAVINYLALLGWSLDDRTEFFSRQELIDHFSLERVNVAPASFDPKKLLAFQDHYMQVLPLEDKVEKSLPFLASAGIGVALGLAARERRLAEVIRIAGDRIKVFGDILQYRNFFAPDDAVEYDEAAFDEHVIASIAPTLLRYRDHFFSIGRFTARGLRKSMLSVVRPDIQGIGSGAIMQLLNALDRDAFLADTAAFDAETLNELVTPKFLHDENKKLSEIVHALRVALTGKATGPGLFDCMEVLGKSSCVARIDRALRRIPGYSNVLEQLILNVPLAIKPLIKVPMRGRVSVYSGAFRVRPDEGSVAGDSRNAYLAHEGRGSIVLGLKPFGAMRFKVAFDTFIPVLPGNVSIEIPRYNATTKGIITSINYENDREVPQKSRTRATGILEGYVTVGDPVELSEVQFLITNFHDYVGTSVRRDLRVSAGRLELKAAEWKITVDALENLTGRLSAAAENGGAVVTHVATCSMANGRRFSPAEYSALISPLRFFLSFVRGKWCAPILHTGLLDTRTVWHDWTFPRTDVWSPGKSWCPVHEIKWISDYYPCFLNAINDPVRHDVISAAIYWYLESNTGTAADSGLIAAQIGLEALYSIAASENRLFGTEYVGESIVEKISQMLFAAQIAVDIPESLIALRKFAREADHTSAVDAIVALRNTCLHWKQDGMHSGHVTYEAWQLALYYLEVLILHFTGFGGNYANRIVHRFVGEVEPVPWQ